MSHPRRHRERHAVQHIRWLRAAVLGANDGLLSTASLIAGVAGAGSARGTILLTGAAGLIAGALSMASGEYVSVGSQADLEAADLAREAEELATDPEAEHRELKHIYMNRGVGPDTADAVASELMAHDALAAHALDELGLTEDNAAQPLVAAATSGISFAIGAALPLIAALVAPQGLTLAFLIVVALSGLALLGGLGAATAGANVRRGVLRVLLLGAASLFISAFVGRWLGAAIS